jgi:hypothetical protein
MEVLGLSPRHEAKRLPASQFPAPADTYVCDSCGSDLTVRLHQGRAHVRRPLGPTWFTCACGRKYISGATEWDNLGDWEKRQWLVDVGAAFVIALGLALVAFLAYFAGAHRSVMLLSILGVVVLLLCPLFPLFYAMLAVPFEIIASIWRTRIKADGGAD